MAMNVHGNPITVSTLRAMPEFLYKKERKEEITKYDKARIALAMKNSRGGDIHISQYVADIGKDLPHERITYCLIYNATGDTLTFVSFQNLAGRLANAPLPVKIANGQWAGFVHVATSDSDSSVGAVVYRGKKSDGDETECDFMFTWGNNQNDTNQVYTQIGEKDTFNLTEACKYSPEPVSTHTWEGCFASVSTGNDRKVFVEAIFTLQGVEF